MVLWIIQGIGKNKNSVKKIAVSVTAIRCCRFIFLGIRLKEFSIDDKVLVMNTTNSESKYEKYKRNPRLVNNNSALRLRMIERAIPQTVIIAKLNSTREFSSNFYPLLQRMFTLNICSYYILLTEVE